MRLRTIGYAILWLGHVGCGGESGTDLSGGQPTDIVILEAAPSGIFGSVDIVSVQVMGDGVRLPDVAVGFRPYWVSAGPAEPPFRVSSENLLSLHPDAWLTEITMATSGVGIAHLLIRFGEVAGEAAIEVSVGALRDTVRIDVRPPGAPAMVLAPRDAASAVLRGVRIPVLCCAPER